VKRIKVEFEFSFQHPYPELLPVRSELLRKLTVRAYKWTLTAGCIISMALFSSAQSDSSLPTGLQGAAVWVPDDSQTTYKNPVIFADYSDPDVVRVGNDFYLTASSFNSAPGLPILHSRDLVNWTIIGHVFQQQKPLPHFLVPQHGNGVWAPSIRYHDGQFHVFYGDPDFGIYMSKARNAAGPWSEPLLIKEAKGWIDPCPFWDDDGSAYLIHAWAHSRSGIKSILTINRLSPDGKQILDQGKMVFDGHAHHPTIEGPKLYKRNGYYYIFAPAGGVATGWQTVLRSRHIYGPYEDKIVMDQGTTAVNGPHQGGWFELKSGESWFMHFQDRGLFGRVVHLQPMIWKNDWPIIGVDPDGDGKGEPVPGYQKPNVGRRYPVANPQTSDEFESTRPGLQWQSQANYSDSWFSLTARKGWLRLRAVQIPKDGVNLWRVPNVLLQKLPGPEFSLKAKFDSSNLSVGERSGLLVTGRDYAYLAIERTSAGFRLVRMTCRGADEGGREAEESSVSISSSTLILRLELKPEATVSFSYSTIGKQFVPIGNPFLARPGIWIGAKVGLFSVGTSGNGKAGYVDIDWFRFDK